METFNRVVYTDLKYFNYDRINIEQFHLLNEHIIIKQITVNITHLDSPQSTTDWSDIYWGL